MCELSHLSDAEKKVYHQQILDAAEKFGGKNFFLQLLERIRETKPHPLVSAQTHFDMALGHISWNKVIFNDKLQLLLSARTKESEQGNLLPDKAFKKYKKTLNMIRTLKPIVFHVKPADKKSGPGFFFQAFEIIDENTTKLNPLFDALFFCSVESIKKVLNYDAR